MFSNNPSQANIFFNSLKKKNNADGVEYLRGLINSTPPTFENDWRDFKGAKRIPDKDMKRLWSKAISGFANTQGGVLIWGIDARKDEKTNIDCAREESLVKKPDIFLSRLREIQPQYTDPPVSNVDYLYFSDNQSNNEGFVVCYIPESSYKPHRAEAADRNYYIRAGDSFHIPSVSLLKLLFYPEFHAYLWPELKLQIHNDNCIINGYIHNSGIGTAKDVVIFFQFSDSIGRIDRDVEWLNANHLFSLRGNERAYYINQPLHPGSVSHFVEFLIKCSNIKSKELKLKFEIFSENNQPLHYKIPMNSKNIHDHPIIIGKDYQI